MPYTESQTQVADISGALINPAKEDGNLASIKTNSDNLPAIKSDLDTLAGAVSGGKVKVSGSIGASFYTRQDTFTATGPGETVDASLQPVSNFAMQIKGTGALATAYHITLEGSLDGTNFIPILDADSANVGDGGIEWSGDSTSPALYFRSRVLSMNLGSATNLVVTVLGM